MALLLNINIKAPAPIHQNPENQGWELTYRENVGLFSRELRALYNGEKKIFPSNYDETYCDAIFFKFHLSAEMQKNVNSRLW